jgi:acyl dehydratase
LNKQFKIGDIATVTKVFDLKAGLAFAELTGDFNPVHFDEEYTKDTIFKKPIVHGPLVITLVTTLFAKELPGPGSIYLSHEVKYIKPVYYGDEITAVVEVVDINEKQHIFLRTTCTNQNGDIILDGIARLKK